MCSGKHLLCQEKIKNIVFALESRTVDFRNHTGYRVLAQCQGKQLKVRF